MFACFSPSRVFASFFFGRALFCSKGVSLRGLGFVRFLWFFRGFVGLFWTCEAECHCWLAEEDCFHCHVSSSSLFFPTKNSSSWKSHFLIFILKLLFQFFNFLILFKAELALRVKYCTKSF
jgi:hypothetical protein